MQTLLFPPESNWKPPKLSELPDWGNINGELGYDLECKDPYLNQLGISVRRGGKICGVGFHVPGHRSYYVPLFHEGGGNVEDPEQGLRYFQDNAKKFKGSIVGANLSFDLDYSIEAGIKFGKQVVFHDIQVGEPLIDQLRPSYSLNSLGKHYGLGEKDESKLIEAAKAHRVDPKAGMYKLHSKYVGAYGEWDSELPVKIFQEQKKLLDQHDLWGIYNLERQVLPILVEMRRRGVRIDIDKLEQIEQWSLSEEARLLAEVAHITGVNIAVGQTMQAGALAPALEDQGYRVPWKPGKRQKQYLIDSAFLEKCGPVGEKLLRARKMSKLRTTFAHSIREHMVKGRIHTTFNQLIWYDKDNHKKGAVTGRLSSDNPNLQQQPSRDDFAPLWRSIYLPEEGALWACMDYSQQEPRWTTHYAAKCKLKGAEAAAKAYWDNPKIDNHQFMADLTGLRRKFAKNVYLGLCYCMGGAKLCEQSLGLPTRWAVRHGRGRVDYFESRSDAEAFIYERGDGRIFKAAGEEGQRILDTFNAKAPFIKQLSDLCVKTAATRGYVRTILGRIMRFPREEKGGYGFTHKGLNWVIQPTSADQMKQAMVNIWKEMPESFIQLQVHDELDGSVSSVAEAKMLAQIMQNAIPDTLVPFRVDVEVGRSWGEIELICGHKSCTHKADKEDKFFCEEHK